MGVRHRAIGNRLRSRARARGAAVRPSVRRPIEAASRGEAAVSRTSPRCWPQADRTRATSSASISTTPRRTWWTPTTRPGANFSTARSRLRPPTCIAALPARSSRWRCRSWRRCPAENFEVRHEANAGAYKIHHSSGYSPALERGRFPLCPWPDRRSARRKRTRRRSRGAARPRSLEGHADQARDRFHHPAKAQADAGGGQRKPRHRGEGAGLSARPGRHPGLSRRSGPSISRSSPRRPSSPPRRPASSCRNRASRLTPSHWPKTARPRSRSSRRSRRCSRAPRPRSAPAICCSSPD